MGTANKSELSVIIKAKDLCSYVMTVTDKDTLERCLAGLRVYAADALKLEFNQKTQIFPVSQGVDYLGWHFYLTDTGKVIRRLRTGNKRRFKRRLKRFKRAYAAGETDLDAIRRSLVSYNGHLRHGHTWKLKKKLYRDFVLSRSGARTDERYNKEISENNLFLMNKRVEEETDT